MLELPEVWKMAEDLRNMVSNVVVIHVSPPTKAHKFCWFQGDPEEYDSLLAGCKITGAEGFGLYVEISFENGGKLCFNDGVNARLLPLTKVPKNYQLLIELENDMALVFTVAMYGGIVAFQGEYDNEYYQKSKAAFSPFMPEFEAHYWKLMDESKPNLSAKAFLATEQRFPGIGNGVLQDILWEARIHPKSKISTLSQEERTKLLNSVRSVLKDMIDKGGRNTEKDLFGKPGGYRTQMSKLTKEEPCLICGNFITKESYLGGTIYYCPVCQRE